MRSHGPADASNGAATTEAGHLVSDREIGHWRCIGTLAIFAACPLRIQKRPNRRIATKRRFVPRNRLMQRSKKAPLCDHLVGDRRRPRINYVLQTTALDSATEMLCLHCSSTVRN